MTNRWTKLTRLLEFSVLAAFVAACGSRPEPELRLPRRIVDLSPSITEDLPVQQLGKKALADFGRPERNRFQIHVIEDPFCAADLQITLYNHVGPHHDPTSHVIKDGKSTDQFPLESFFGRARGFDFRAKPKDQPLLPADFEGKGIRPGEIVIACVGYTPPADPQELPS